METQNKTIKALEFDKILSDLAKHTRIKQSNSLCFTKSIYSSIYEIKKQLEYTREAKNLLDYALELPLEYVLDVKQLEKSSLDSYLNEEELINTAKTLRTARLVRNFLRENSENCPNLNEFGEMLYANKNLEEQIFETFDDNLNIKKDATPELKSLYSSLKDSETNLKTRVNELLNKPDFTKHLQEQIYTTRDERIVFQVRASSKTKIEGIIHDVSASNQTFYIEPKQIVSLNNKIRETKAKIQAEIINILSTLTKLVKNDLENLKVGENILAEIDFHFAKARYAIKLKAVEPEINEKKEINISNLKHPLLMNYTENVIENDFEVGKDYKSIIITGSNTGGKTVLIKAIGLFILMAEFGLFLPCSEAKIYPFKSIFADIGDEQSIAQNLSTFSSHMTNIINILNNSDEESFVVIDEICAGTDPVEGSVLAQVILEKLAQKNVTSCITTHYGELKSLEFSNNYFKNASVEFDSETLKPTYKLIIGIPGLSNAILISSNLGLEEALVKKAKEILISQKDPSIMVVENLQEMQQKISKNLQESEELNYTAINLKKDYEKRISELKKDKKKTINVIKNKLDGEMETAKNEIKDILKEMREEKSEKIARRSYARLAKLEKSIYNSANQFEENETYEEIDWINTNIGDKLLLKELHQTVILLSLPDKNNNVTVQMGLIKTKINANKLTIYNEKLISKTIRKYIPQTTFRLARQEQSNTLDLRGYRVEEGLDSLEYFLDKASLTNLTTVYIIHGIGTGALKAAIQEFLATSPYVAKYRFGESAEGGDGVSVVELK